MERFELTPSASFWFGQCEQKKAAKKVLPSTKIEAILVFAGTKMTVLEWKKQQKVLPSTKIWANLVLAGTKSGVISNEKFGY